MLEYKKSRSNLKRFSWFRTKSNPPQCDQTVHVATLFWSLMIRKSENSARLLCVCAVLLRNGFTTGWSRRLPSFAMFLPSTLLNYYYTLAQYKRRKRKRFCLYLSHHPLSLFPSTRKHPPFRHAIPGLCSKFASALDGCWQRIVVVVVVVVVYHCLRNI